MTSREPCFLCGAPSAHVHHRKMRSQGGGDEPDNLLRVCLRCHDTIHSNPEHAYSMGWLVKSWQEPDDVPVMEHVDVTSFGETNRQYMPGSRELDLSAMQDAYDSGGAVLVEPGNTCPTCLRPVRKKTPNEEAKVRKTIAFAVPVSERENGAETIDTLLEEARKELALAGLPFGDGEKVKFYVLSAVLGLFVSHAKEILADA